MDRYNKSLADSRSRIITHLLSNLMYKLFVALSFEFGVSGIGCRDLPLTGFCEVLPPVVIDGRAEAEIFMKAIRSSGGVRMDHI